jgi:hypothetical protein
LDESPRLTPVQGVGDGDHTPVSHPIDAALRGVGGSRRGDARMWQRTAAWFRLAGPWPVAALCVIGAFAFIARRGQDQNYDLLNYHFFAGYAALTGRSTDVAPMGLPSFFDPLPSALAYLAYAKLSFPWSAFLIGAVQLCVVPFVVLVQRELCAGSRHGAADPQASAALLIGFASPLWLSELGTSFYSSTTATLVVAAMWLILRAARGDAVTSVWLLPAGALLGLAMGLKLTNAIYVPAAICAIVAAHRTRRQRGTASSCAWLVLGALAGFAPTAPWYVGLAQAYRSPLFPLFNGWLRSPYAPPIDVRDARWAFPSVADWIRFVFAASFGTQATSEVPFADARLALGLMLALAVAATRPWRRRAAATIPDAAGTALLTFVATSVLAWSFALAYQRYLVADELLLGATIYVLARRLPLRRPWQGAMLGTALVVTCLCLRVPDWVHVTPPSRGNVFGLRVPAPLANEPADYLVAGAPMSFAFAFLQPDSRFVRIDFLPELDPVVNFAIAGFGARPVRLLATEDALVPALQRASHWGYSTLGQPCMELRSTMIRMRWCDLHPRR